MVQKTHYDYDLIVIGSGAAGSVAALAARRAGKNVAIIEKATFGGESPNWGDIPMQSLLHVGHLYHQADAGKRFGIRSSTLGYNFPTILQWKETVIKRTGAGGNRKYYEKQGIIAHKGRAHFLAPNEISVNRKRLTARQFIIATGSHFVQPDIHGIETITPLTPRTALDLKRPPKSIFIIGGGINGVEFAQFFAIFGSKVTISEIGSRLLPDEDEEVGTTMAGVLHKHHGITCITETQVVAVEKKRLGVRVTYTRGGVEHTVHVDEVLVTENRTPSLDIGLENAHVSYTSAGITTNEHLQTSSRHIYAAGDVVGSEHATHIALMQGRIAAHNLLKKDKARPNYNGTPRLTMTFPGVASVGLTENDCIKRDLRIKQAIAPLGITSRSNTNDFKDGFVKLIADNNDRLLGGVIVSPNAAEAVHELSLAIKHNMTARDIANTPHAFLSWSEAIRIAATKLAQQ